MHSFKHLDPKLYDPAGIKQDFRKTARGKKKLSQVRRVREDPEKHERILIEQLRSNTFTKPSHECSTINEHSCRKVRQIQKPAYLYEQPAHHALIRACMPAFMRGMYKWSCASIPDRGCYYGKDAVERWLRDDWKNCKYVLKFDIHHFFQSIPHRKLKKALKKRIRDRQMLSKLFAVIDSCEKGVPIGYYTSQWFGNFYLTPLDHIIASHGAVTHFIRYMDDYVLFGRNKKELRKAFDMITAELAKLGLKVKRNWQLFRFEYISHKDKKVHGVALDFMGFVFHRGHTGIRKSIIYRARRKVNRTAKKARIPWFDACSIISRMGYFLHTDTYMYFRRHISTRVIIRKLKRAMAKHQRKVNKIERMENSNRTERAG